jgi:hypothetical protein
MDLEFWFNLDDTTNKRKSITKLIYMLAKNSKNADNIQSKIEKVEPTRSETHTGYM